MGLADDRDDVVGFLTFSSAPYPGAAAARPAGAACRLEARDGEVRAEFSGLADPAAHWLHVDLFDRATGRVVEGTAGARTVTIPPGMTAGQTVAVASVDLFPLAVVTA
jgi:hypothetical protein